MPRATPESGTIQMHHQIECSYHSSYRSVVRHTHLKDTQTGVTHRYHRRIMQNINQIPHSIPTTRSHPTGFILQESKPRCKRHIYWYAPRFNQIRNIASGECSSYVLSANHPCGFCTKKDLQNPVSLPGFVPCPCGEQAFAHRTSTPGAKTCHPSTFL